MACDAVFQRTSPWQKLFAVDRAKVLGGAWDYLVENAEYPYHFIKDRSVATNRGSTEQVKRGGGMTLNLDGTRAACSRDSAGVLHTVSAYRTHMGCLVRWNNGEQTWDCPCHGSRFQPDGKVIAGSAEANLEHVQGDSNRRIAIKSHTHTANTKK
jgi:Rieske Fe-S protein